MEIEHFLDRIDEEVFEEAFEVNMLHLFDPKDPTKAPKIVPFREHVEPTPSLPEVRRMIPSFLKSLTRNTETDTDTDPGTVEASGYPP